MESSLIKSLEERIYAAVSSAVKEEIGTVKIEFQDKWSDVVKRLENVKG
jgi:hypothetical protein